MNMIKTLTENRIKDIPDFHRVPAHDFRDDGTSFTCWVYKGIPMTQARSGGQTYLSLRTDYISSLRRDGLSNLVFDIPYEFWHDNKGKDVEDVFNGVSEFDFDQLLKNCDILIEQIKTVTEKFDKIEIEEFPIEEQCWKESKFLNDFTEDIKTKFNWMEASKYDTDRFKDYWKSLKRYAECANNHAFEYRMGEVSKRVAYEDSNRLAKYGYVTTQINDDEFYIKELKEMVEKYKGAAA